MMRERSWGLASHILARYHDGSIRSIVRMAVKFVRYQAVELAMHRAAVNITGKVLCQQGLANDMCACDIPIVAGSAGALECEALL